MEKKKRGCYDRSDRNDLHSIFKEDNIYPVSYTHLFQVFDGSRYILHSREDRELIIREEMCIRDRSIRPISSRSKMFLFLSISPYPWVARAREFFARIRFPLVGNVFGFMRSPPYEASEACLLYTSGSKNVLLSVWADRRLRGMYREHGCLRKDGGDSKAAGPACRCDDRALSLIHI